MLPDMILILALCIVWFDLNSELHSIKHILRRMEKALTPAKPSRLVITLTGGIKEGNMRNLRDDDTTGFAATLGEKDTKGFPTDVPFDDKPVWSASDTDILSVVPADDGMSAKVLPTGNKLGVAQVLVSVNVAGAPLAGKSEDINIVPGAPATIAINLA